MDTASLNADSQKIDGEIVRVERVLNAPIDKVWSYLIDSDKRAKWFAAGEFAPRVGGKTELRFHHDTLSADKSPPGWKMDGAVVFPGVVTAYDPPRLLAWQDEGIGQCGSEVRFELTPQGERTQLVILHSRLAHADRIGASAGWGAHLNILEDVLAERKPRGFWTMNTALKQHYETRYGLGHAIAPDTFQIKRVLKAPIEKVWSYLVDADKRSRWFNAGDDIRANGQAFELHFGHHRITDEKPPAKHARFDGSQPDMVMQTKVLALEPPRLLRIMWPEGAHGGEVTFELEPQTGGTLLTLTHSKLASRAQMLDVAGGWTAHLDVLGQEFRGEPHVFWGALERLDAEYERLIPS